MADCGSDQKASVMDIWCFVLHLALALYCRGLFDVQLDKTNRHTRMCIFLSSQVLSSESLDSPAS